VYGHKSGVVFHVHQINYEGVKIDSRDIFSFLLRVGHFRQESNPSELLNADAHLDRCG